MRPLTSGTRNSTTMLHVCYESAHASYRRVRVVAAGRSNSFMRCGVDAIVCSRLSHRRCRAVFPQISRENSSNAMRTTEKKQQRKR